MSDMLRCFAPAFSCERHESVYLDSMMKKRSFIGLFPAILVVLASCNNKEIDYTTIDIELENYDNSTAYIQPAGSSVSDSAYVLRIKYVSDQTGFYAVDDKNKYIGTNRPVSIEVRSLQFFDSLHPAGTLLNDYFIAGPGIGSSVNDVINDYPDTRDYYPTHEPDDLWLMKTPEFAGAFRFIVTMRFDDGKICTDTAAAINLVP